MLKIQQAIEEYGKISILPNVTGGKYIVVPLDLITKEIPNNQVLMVKELSTAATSIVNELGDNFNNIDYYFETNFDDELVAIQELTDYLFILKLLIFNWNKKVKEYNIEEIDKVNLYILTDEDFKPEIEIQTIEKYKEVVIDKTEGSEVKNVEPKDEGTTSLLDKYIQD